MLMAEEMWGLTLQSIDRWNVGVQGLLACTTICEDGVQSKVKANKEESCKAPQELQVGKASMENNSNSILSDFIAL